MQLLAFSVFVYLLLRNLLVSTRSEHQGIHGLYTTREPGLKLRKSTTRPNAPLKYKYNCSTLAKSHLKNALKPGTPE